MADLFKTIHEDNEAWRDWFHRQDVAPYEVTYEGPVSEPRATVHGIAAGLGVAVAASWKPSSPHRRQADQVDDDWAQTLRGELAHADDRSAGRF
jgi:LPS sulfotransferase NodH